MDLTNKYVLVSGANRGLGKALVSELLDHGVARVYAAARDPQSITYKDPRVVPLALDVTDPASVSRCVQNIDSLDLLINNAGVLRFGSAFETEHADFQYCLDVNMSGLWRLSLAVAPILTTRSGAICNILSLLSLASMPGLAAYNASKAAAWSVTQSLRGSLKSDGVDVYAAYPGAIDTDMIADVDMEKESASDIAKYIIQGIVEKQEDIFPGAASEVYQNWRADHKAVERAFASM